MLWEKEEFISKMSNTARKTTQMIQIYVGRKSKLSIELKNKIAQK